MPVEDLGPRRDTLTAFRSIGECTSALHEGFPTPKLLVLSESGNQTANPRPPPTLGDRACPCLHRSSGPRARCLRQTLPLGYCEVTSKILTLAEKNGIEGLLTLIFARTNASVTPFSGSVSAESSIGHSAAGAAVICAESEPKEVWNHGDHQGHGEGVDSRSTNQHPRRGNPRSFQSDVFCSISVVSVNSVVQRRPRGTPSSLPDY